MLAIGLKLLCVLGGGEGLEWNAGTRHEVVLMAIEALNASDVFTQASALQMLRCLTQADRGVEELIEIEGDLIRTSIDAFLSLSDGFPGSKTPGWKVQDGQVSEEEQATRNHRVAINLRASVMSLSAGGHRRGGDSDGCYQ